MPSGRAPRGGETPDYWGDMAHGSVPGDRLNAATAAADPLHLQADLGVEEEVHNRAAGFGLFDHSCQRRHGFIGAHNGAHPDGLEVRPHRPVALAHKAPSTACNGEGPWPVPPWGIGSSRVIRPGSPKSTTVRMVAPLCAVSALLRRKPVVALSLAAVIVTSIVKGLWSHAGDHRQCPSTRDSSRGRRPHQRGESSG
jgi:hypothetical protein